MLELAQARADGKMELLSITSELMPSGKPKFLDVVRYPMIRELSKFDKSSLVKVLYLMVKDFCSSINVVRNMNEDQMIEAAAMLLDECGNFRLEDYVMMFTMAKRGSLVKILDRMDLQVIGLMMEEYWTRRNAVAQAMQDEEAQHYDTLGPLARNIEQLHPSAGKLVEAMEGLASGFSALKEFTSDLSVEEAVKQIVPNPNYKNLFVEEKI